MPPQPDPSAVDRLAKVAARLGSDFAGEQAAAATLGTGILAGFGMSWTDLVARAFQAAPQIPPRASRPAPQPPHAELARAAMRHQERLTGWERQFLADVALRARLTPKQHAVLTEIVAKLRASSAA